MADGESRREAGQRLGRLRVALGYDTQTAWAAAIGATLARWNNVEAGRARLSLDMALAIKRKWQSVTLDWLVLGDASSMPVELVQRMEALANQRLIKHRGRPPGTRR